MQYIIGATYSVAVPNIKYGSVTILGDSGFGKSCGKEYKIYNCLMLDGTTKQISEILLEPLDEKDHQK